MCQPGSGQGSVCVPACQVATFPGGSFDTCGVFSPGVSCNTTTGVCALPDGGEPDAGLDGGDMDSGVATVVDAGSDAGSDLAGSGKSGTRSSGCSSSASTAAPDVFLGIVGLMALVRRSKT